MKQMLLLFLVLGFFSCEKDEIIDLQKKEVKLFLSNTEEVGSNLKSAEVNNEKSITNGDTVDFSNSLGVNLIVSAEKQNGNPLRGNFFSHLEDGDFEIEDNYTLAGGYVSYAEKKTLFSIKLESLGLYKVIFTPRSQHYEEKVFYICHCGIPGEVGDGRAFDYSFRMDKKIFFGSKTQAGYIMYIKGKKEDFSYLDGLDLKVDPTKEKNFQAFMNCLNSVYINPVNQRQYPAKNFTLKKCKYSKGYYYFAFLKNKYLPIQGEYKIYFYTGEFKGYWWLFPSMRNSDYYHNNMIVFKVL